MESKKKIALLFNQHSKIKHVFLKIIDSSHLKDKIQFTTLIAEQNLNETTKNLDGAFLDYFLTKEQIRLFLKLHPMIKWIHGPAAGIDHLVDIPQIFENPSLTFTNGRGTYNKALGSLVLAAILHFNLKLPEYLAQKQLRKTDMIIPEPTSDKTVGIIGMGSIGAQVAKRVKLGLDMKVMGIRKRPEKTTPEVMQYLDKNLGLDSLQELLGNSDFVVNILPKTEDTLDFYDETKFKMMKKSGVFINIGRGASVDEEALIKVLKEKQIRGAFLDVIKTKPLPLDHGFWDLENIVLTMHTGGITHQTLQEIGYKFLKNVERLMKGEELENVVEKGKGY